MVTGASAGPMEKSASLMTGTTDCASGAVVGMAEMTLQVNSGFAVLTITGLATRVGVAGRSEFVAQAVWIFARQIDSPAQGFVLGALSGVAFALIESLNASADSSASWGVIVSARAGTSLLHLTTSALVGWGIVSLFKEKRFGRFFAAYFSAVLVHGIWNASAAGAGIASIGELIGKPEWLFNLAPALICGLVVLGIGMFAVLLKSNRSLRTEPKPIPTEEVKVESSS